MKKDQVNYIAFFQLFVVLLLIFLGTGQLNAQLKVGNNATSLNSNAIFEIESTNKGMLLPRLALVSTTSSAPLSAHVSGMTVYNTATTADVTPGIYYNNGTVWVRIMQAPLATNNTTSGPLVTISNGVGATLTAMSVAIDTTALKTFIASNMGTSPIKESFTTTVNNVIQSSTLIGQNLSAGTLLQTTGTPAGASLKAAGYQVDTTALKSFVNARSTNTLSNATNTITSTVNGIVASAPAVNTVANTFNSTTRALTTTVNGVVGTSVTLPGGNDSTTASNGLALTGKDVRLGGTLTGATTLTTSATNTLALAGLQSGSSTDSILVVNPITGVIARKAMPSGMIMKRVKLSSATMQTISDPNTPESPTPIIATYEDTTGAVISVNIVSRTANTSFTIHSATNVGSGYLNYAYPSQGIVLATGPQGPQGPQGVGSRDSTTASNGLTMIGKDVQLGGALTKATTVSGLSATNKMSYTGAGVDAFNIDGTTFSVDATNNQIGIGTAMPSEALDVVGNVKFSGALMPNNTAGIDGQVLISAGANVAPTWVNVPNMTFGDIKTGFQSADHGGWVLLNGRAISTLSAAQQARAAALGFTTNLPNASNTYLSQNGGTLGSISSANTKNIAQNQLPNINLAHTHSASVFNENYTWGTGGGRHFKPASQFSNETDNTTINTTNLYLNGNVTQVAFDVRPSTMSVNVFLFLGN
jgi:hypothetical protein